RQVTPPRGGYEQDGARPIHQSSSLDSAASRRVKGSRCVRITKANRESSREGRLKRHYIALALAVCACAQDHTTRSDSGGALDSAQYSALKQIDRSNVSRLDVAWTYPIGDGKKYFFAPLVVDNVVYVLAKDNSIAALDAANGKELWRWSGEERITIITHR